MTAIVGFINKCGLKIEMCHRNQPNNTSKLALYKPLLSL